MELRLLGTERERQIFAERVVQARADREAGAAETPKSRLTQAHIAFANLYGLFPHEGDLAERMIAGLAMHDLEMLPQSYPRPDLTHLPPRSVVECGEFWSLTSGAGLLVRRGLVATWKLTGVRAVLIYAIVKPWNTAKALARYFQSAGEPIDFPFARAFDGSPVWVQPMVMLEEGIKRLFDRLGAARFEVSEDLTRIRFDSPLPFQASQDPLVTSTSGAEGQPGISASAAGGAQGIALAQR